MKKVERCSFCYSPKTKAGDLIKGLGSFICRPCVEFCLKIFEAHAENEKWKAEQARIKSSKIDPDLS